MNLLLAPNDILTMPTIEVDPTTPGALAIAADLMQALADMPEAAAIAAPQIGATVSMLAYRDHNRDPVVLSNPKLVESRGHQLGWESCLSFPDLRFMVSRPRAVVIAAQDIVGEWVRLAEHDFYARMFCHEIDHLHGILITKRAKGPGVPR